MRTLLVAIVMLAGLMQAGVAQDLGLAGSERWVVIASAQDRDKAIGVARLYADRLDGVRVVESANGWLAVIGGPVSIAQGEDAARAALMESVSPPQDMFFAQGGRFERTVWQPADTPVASWRYEGVRAPMEISEQGLSIEVSMRNGEDGFVFPVLALTDSRGAKYKVALDDSNILPEQANAEVRIAQLEAGAYPQIVFSSYWMGAHCCTVTKILTHTESGWAAVEGDVLDGAPGYSLVDFADDGTLELVSADNSFYYAFAPFAGSWAPTAIARLEGTRLVDLRADPDFQSYFRQEAFGLEHWAERNPELWQQNGFLAAWVAARAVVGDFEDAWDRILTLYNRADDWPLTVCTADSGDAACPEDAQRSASFPQALRDHLELRGYIGAVQE